MAKLPDRLSIESLLNLTELQKLYIQSSSGDESFDMAPVKSTKVAVESTDGSDEDMGDIELQAGILFDEFLRLYHPADTFSDERTDSPVPMTEPQGLKVEQLHYGKSSFPEEDDTLECDCSALPASKTSTNSVVYMQSVARNGSRLSPVGRLASAQERNESDFVAQGESLRPEAAVSPNADQAKKLSEVAAKLQGAGDQLVREYGKQLREVESALVLFVKEQGAQLTYDALANTVQKEVEKGTDVNFTTFMMTLHLSKVVGQKAGNVCKSLQGYFRQYFLQRYSDVMQQSGGVENFALPRRGAMRQ